ncbi:hypothetical protein [Devosia riboflavina]
MTEPYGVGTVSVANGGATVTGTSTFWVGKVRKNDLFTVPAQGLFARVTADPTENDELSINGWPGDALVDADYEIISTYIAVDTASRTRELLLGLSLIDPNYDVQVNTLPDRAAFDDKLGPTPTARGFAVLVSDDGDGAAIYSKLSNATADWSERAAYSGPTGNEGWSPQLVAEADGERRVLKLAGYVGGEGIEPTDNVGEYLKADGTFTATIGDAVDIRGEGFVFRGGYGSGTAYAKNDVVRDAGSSWIALQATNGNAPPTLPTTSNAYWELLAQKGNDGAGTIVSLVAGSGITIDATDPNNPVISAAAQLAEGEGVSIDVTDPDEPVISIDTGTTFIGGRLSLVSGDPLPEADVVGASSVYLVPTVTNYSSLWTGVFWKLYEFDQLTLSLVSAHASGNNYDVWEFADAGALNIGTGPAWTAGAVAGSATARGTGAGATELELWKGRLVNKNSMTLRNGATTYSVAARACRLRGSIRMTANGQAEDSKTKRFVSNVHNPEPRPMLKVDGTASWAYSTATWRQARAATDNQVEYLQCVSGRRLKASVMGILYNSTTTFQNAAVGMGLDSATVDSSQRRTGAVVNNRFIPCEARYDGYPSLGYHSVKWLEIGAGADTQTWVGDFDNATGYFQSGIEAETFL